MATTHELSTLGHVIKPAYESQPNTNAFTDAEKSKLAGIQSAATANATDAQLRNRATHTGTQTAATIIDLPDLLATKVDVVAGKSLTDANYTAAEKAKLAGLEDAHFKGVHVGLSGLEDAHPTASAGDYAVVDDGVDLIWYQWDMTGAEWVPRVGESGDITPAQVKTYYESNPDTNAFTNTYKSQLDNLALRYGFRRRGTWNAATNTPTLLNGGGVNGDYYVVTTPGSYDFGLGVKTFNQYDWVFYEGGAWSRLAVDPVIPTPPNPFTPRGPLSPAIPAYSVYKNASQSIPPLTRTTVTGWFINYQHHGTMVNGVYTAPEWATHIRITAGVSMQDLAANTLVYSEILNGTTIIARTTVPGYQAQGGVALNLGTAIIPIGATKTFSCIVEHRDPNPRSILLGRDTFFNVELFETL